AVASTAPRLAKPTPVETVTVQPLAEPAPAAEPGPAVEAAPVAASPLLAAVIAPLGAAAEARAEAGPAAVPGAGDPFRQDEFLRAPTLFKHGPWLLLVLGTLLAASFFVAGYWRIDAGRHGVYETAFAFAKTTAGAA